MLEGGRIRRDVVGIRSRYDATRRVNWFFAAILCFYEQSLGFHGRRYTPVTAEGRWNRFP